MLVSIYTDGSSLNNPGPGGWAAILEYRDAQGQIHRKELSQGFECTTNNRMELLGPICALEALKFSCEVEIFTDSQYVVNAFNQRWIQGWQKRGWKTSQKEPVKNKDLWLRLIAACECHSRVSWHWIKGHAGHPQNERCDILAKNAALSSNKLCDEGFQS